MDVSAVVAVVSAVVSLGALVATAAQARSARAQVRIGREQTDLQREMYEEEQRQAQRAETRALAEERRQQATYVQLSDARHGGAQGRRDEHWVLTRYVTVANQSLDVITDVLVTMEFEDPVTKTITRRQRRWPRLLSGQTENFNVNDVQVSWVENIESCVVQSLLEFTDAAGVRWARDADHRLHEVHVDRGTPLTRGNATNASIPRNTLGTTS